VGESLGGAVAADLSVHRKVRALVLESTFVSLIEQAKSIYPFLPVEYIMVEKYDTLSKVQKIQIPKLILHGKDDEIVPIKFAQKLYSVATDPKKYISYEGGHSEGVYKVSQEYQQELNQFFEQYNILQ
jgi:fermentation-respiration switch protein FrsA (DUF1100 family)